MEQKPVFRLEGVFLEKSTFEKYSTTEALAKPILSQPQISAQKLPENQVKVCLHINIFVERAMLSSTMMAQCEFLVENLSDEQFFQFTQINIPAIIFGFMREHITSTFQKAGLPLFIHQPINFIQLAEEKKKNIQSEKP